MEKEYISTVVIDSESAAKDWLERPEGKQDENSLSDDRNADREPAFTGVHTWVS